MTQHTENAARKLASVGGEAPAKPAGHDTAPPKALLDFMVQRWKPAPRKLQGQDSARLFVGEAHLVAFGDDGPRVGDQRDQGHHVAGRPVAQRCFGKATGGQAVAKEQGGLRWHRRFLSAWRKHSEPDGARSAPDREEENAA